MMVLAVVALVIPAIYAQVTQHKHPEHIESHQPRHLLGPARSPTRPASSSRSRATSTSSRPRASDAAEELGDDGRVWSVGKSLRRAARRPRASWAGSASSWSTPSTRRARPWACARSSWASWSWRIVGNAAEHSTAVLVAMKGKMDLALGIAMGSSMQIALFVAPVLVIAGHCMGTPLGLEFTILEVVAVMLSVARRLAPDPRRQDQLVRGPPAPRHLLDPGHRLLLHLDIASAFPAQVGALCASMETCGRGILARAAASCFGPRARVGLGRGQPRRRAGRACRPRRRRSRKSSTGSRAQTGMKVVYEGGAPRNP